MGFRQGAMAAIRVNINRRGKPEDAPQCPAALILGIAEHGRVAPPGARLLVLLRRVRLPGAQSDAAAGIRRIGQHGINACCWKSREDCRKIPMICSSLNRLRFIAVLLCQEHYLFNGSVFGGGVSREH